MTRHPTESTPPPATPPAPHQMWGGRFSLGPSEALDALNRSLPVDHRLWPQDVTASKAWVHALGRVGVLTSADFDWSDRSLYAMQGMPSSYWFRQLGGPEPFAIDQVVTVDFGESANALSGVLLERYGQVLAARGGEVGLVLDGRLREELGVDALLLSSDNRME